MPFGCVFRFPLGLRMVEELPAARAIIVSHETARQWAHKFGQQFAHHIRCRLPPADDKWHLDEVVLRISGMKHCSEPDVILSHHPAPLFGRVHRADVVASGGPERHGA